MTPVDRSVASGSIDRSIASIGARATDARALERPRIVHGPARDGVDVFDVADDVADDGARGGDACGARGATSRDDDRRAGVRLGVGGSRAFVGAVDGD